MNLKSIKKVNWSYAIDRLRSPIINSIMITGITNRYENEIPISYDFENMAFINGVWYGDEDKNQYLMDQIGKALEKNSLFIYKIAQKQYRIWESFERKLRKLKNINFSERSNKDLKSYFDEISNFLLSWNSVNIWFMWISERIHEKKIREIINEKAGKNDEKIFSLLTNPSKKGFFEKEKTGIVKIAIMLKKERLSLNDKKTKDIIKRHLKEYAWLGNPDFKGSFWQENDIIERIKGLRKKSLEKLNELISSKNKRQINNAIKELDFSSDESNIVKSTRELVYFRTFRTDIQAITFYLVNRLFMEIAKRMNISFKDLHYLFYNEISSFLSTGKVNKEPINKRKKGYAVVILNGKSYYFDSKKDVGDLNALFKKDSTVGKMDIIKGSIANSGKISGTVKIIHDVRDMRKVRDGDILVTLMTKPKYISAMERAAAFITDEGGITCHAAIISREMNKPCVVGTKIATKVLKDGDLVEVDADKGVIKIIKKI